MRNTPDFTPKSAQNAYKQKITVADIVSTTVTDLVAEMGFEPHDLRVMSSKNGVLYCFAMYRKVLILCDLYGFMFYIIL